MSPWALPFLLLVAVLWEKVMRPKKTSRWTNLRDECSDCGGCGVFPDQQDEWAECRQCKGVGYLTVETR